MYSETNDRNLNFTKATLYKENWYALLISIILNKSISKSLSIMKAREDQYIKLNIKGEKYLKMTEQYYDSKEIQMYLKGREFLLSDKYNWITESDKEIAIASMNSRYQINCMKWLVICLDKLKTESEEVKSEVLPLIVNKMEEFKELFPLSIKKEKNALQFKENYKEIKKEFNITLKLLKLEK